MWCQFTMVARFLDLNNLSWQRWPFALSNDGWAGADPGFFLGGGAPVSCSTSTPINHIVFFLRRIPVVLENRRPSEGGGGAHPLHPPPRSAPDELPFCPWVQSCTGKSYSLTSPYAHLPITDTSFGPRNAKNHTSPDTWFCPFGVHIKEVWLYMSIFFHFFLPYLQEHGFLRSKNFATMATWRSDFPSPFCSTKDLNLD